VAVAALFLSACGNSDEQVRTKEGLTELNVGVLKMAALTTPVIAQAEGFFRSNGLKVKLVEFKSGAEASSAMQGGDVDIALSIPGAAMTAKENGFDITAIFQNEIAKAHGPDSGAILVSADSKLTSLADLKGAKFAVSNLGSQKTVGDLKLLADAGVTREDLQLLEMPYGNMYDALRTGQLDAASVVDPYTTQLLTSGVGKVLSWDYVESLPEQPVGAFYAKSDWIKSNPDAVEAFGAAMKAAVDFANADEARAQKAVADYTGLEESLVADMPAIGWSYEVDTAKWQEVSDMLTDAGVLREKHEAKEFMSDYLLSYAD
jgi:NitT/TauT family transport system substrate-binding protein